MNRIVLDTNVLISGLIRAAGPPGRIVDAMRAGAVTPVVDDRILDEYSEVLRRPFFSRYVSAIEVEAILSFLASNGEMLVATRRVVALPDVSDIPFAEAAVTAGVPLVTGNARHFPPASVQGLTVLSPSEFAKRL